MQRGSLLWSLKYEAGGYEVFLKFVVEWKSKKCRFDAGSGVSG